VAAESDPLVGAPPPEVPLRDAPLVRVIAQLRFPVITMMTKQEFIAPFQEAIRSTYPILRQEQTQGFMMAPLGPVLGQKQIAWRFSDIENAWRVSLTPEFLALETTRYRSRDDFLARLQTLVVALQQHIEPKVLERLGLRCIDRIAGEALGDIGTLVRHEVLGVVETPLHQYASHILSETLLQPPEAKEQILVRWGRLPAGATVDPFAIEPIGQASWILDLDMFSTEQRPFVSEQILADARRYAERLYSVFRWAVTDEFLRRYGGAA